MFKLNLKIAFRNLWKNITYTTINIFGLAAGLSGFLVILLYINYETGYDKWDPSLKTVYQVGFTQVKNGAEKKEREITGHFVQMIKTQFPEVQAVTMGSWGGKPFSWDYEYRNKKYQPNFSYAGVDSTFLSIYPIKAVAGHINNIFSAKNNVAISLSIAREMFGDEDPLGKTIIRKGGANFKDEPQQVVAVFDNEVYRSYFGISMIGAQDLAILGDEVLDVSYNVMLKLSGDTDIPALTRKLNDAYLIDQAKRISNNSKTDANITPVTAKKILQTENGITSQEIVLECVNDLNLNSRFADEPKQKGIYILTALATFLIIISCVNFTNLAVVQATGRAKEVGIRKVMGAYRSSLTRQFLLETSTQCLIAFFIAFILTELALPGINSLLGVDLVFFRSPDLGILAMQGVAILAVIVVVSGIYPALLLSGLMPSRVLKGNFSTGKEGVGLRKGLLITQFTISGALVVCFFIMNAQLNFMRDKNLGMNPEQVMTISIQDYGNRRMNPDQFNAIKQRLLNIKGVEAVSRSTDAVTNSDAWKADLTYVGTTVEVAASYGDLDLFRILEAKIVQGRDFSSAFMATDTVNSIILNQTAVNNLSLTDPVGKVITITEQGTPKQVNVIGVVADIKNNGFATHVQPTAYLVYNFAWKWRRVAYLKLNDSDIAATIDAVKKEWKIFEPKVDPVYSFADERFAKLNASYERMGRIMFAFSAITLLVSVLGLFTLAAFNSKIRIREIAIRKILGASTRTVLQLLNADLVKLVIVANILADVLAYIYMEQWFTTFAYRISMPWITFVLVNTGTILITIFTVTLQSLNAVKMNPSKVLKYE